MMKKIGINTTRFEKSGPTVKKGVAAPKEGRFTKRVVCPECGANLEKSCDNEMFCDISTVKCPKCGADLNTEPCKCK